MDVGDEANAEEKRSVAKLWEVAAQAMCKSPSEWAWRSLETEARAATLAIVRALSEIDVPEDVCVAADDAEVHYSEGKSGIYGPEYRAINKAFAKHLEDKNAL